MGDAWKPGDLARRVEDPMIERAEGACPPAIASVIMPRVGTDWFVLAVEYYDSPEEGRPLPYLKLRGQPSDWIFDARLFRKIRPVAVEVAAKREVLA